MGFSDCNIFSKKPLKIYRMKKFIPLLLLPLLLAIASCFPRVHQNADAANLVSQYQKIAIVPPNVQILKLNNFGDLDKANPQRNTSYDFQKEMYNWFQRRVIDGKYSFKIQEIDVTNDLLKNAGYYDGKQLSNEEIAKLLNVDGVIFSDYEIEKPFPNSVKVLTNVILSNSTTSGIVDRNRAMLNLYDKGKNDMIWNYKLELEARYNTPESLINDLMRNASKKFPSYKK